MNRRFACAGFLALLIAAASSGVACAQQEPDWTTLARRIVRTSAQAEPGDVVVVNGGKSSIPATEARALNVQTVGGYRKFSSSPMVRLSALSSRRNS